MNKNILKIDEQNVSFMPNILGQDEDLSTMMALLHATNKRNGLKLKNQIRATSFLKYSLDSKGGNYKQNSKRLHTLSTTLKTKYKTIKMIIECISSYLI